MNFDLSENQRLMQESFARFFDETSTPEQVRRALDTGGFDRDMWRGLAELGAFGIRVPEAHGGLGLGILDAVILLEEAGRTLALGPIAETLVGARLLATCGAEDALVAEIIEGTRVVSLAFHDVTSQPKQWVSGGSVADLVIAFRSHGAGRSIEVFDIANTAVNEPNLASTALAEIDFTALSSFELGTTPAVIAEFERAIEEWKLLISAALSGLANKAIVDAAAYATERVAFGQPIGTYQGISYPLADNSMHVLGGKCFLYRTLSDIASDEADAAAKVSLVAWWASKVATEAVAAALHTYGGYGLTLEYDVHLYNLRSQDLVLIWGDPTRLLEEAGERLYGDADIPLPEVGELSIDIDLGDEAREIAAEVDQFFTATLTPELKAKAHYSFEGHDSFVHKKVADAGLLFPSWPKEYGGRDAGPYVMEAIRGVWEHHNWTTHAVSTTSMVGVMIRLFGSDEVKGQVLPKIINGEVVCSLGYSEPSCGSDVFAAKTKATKDGENWRIDGSKMFTSGAEHADYVLMLTRTNPEVPKHKGLMMFLVPLKADGVEVQAVHTFQDERTNITYYDGVRIPDSYRLGPVDGGLKVMAGALELEHGGGGFTRTQRAMTRAAEALCGEISHGGRPLIEDRSAQTRLARANAHVWISEMLTYYALWWSEQKRPNCGYGPMSKLFSSETFVTDARDLLHLTAPLSLSKRPGAAALINQCYRHAQASTIYGGTSEVHRGQIAERTLGLPRSRG